MLSTEYEPQMECAILTHTIVSAWIAPEADMARGWIKATSTRNGRVTDAEVSTQHHRVENILCGAHRGAILRFISRVPGSPCSVQGLTSELGDQGITVFLDVKEKT